MSLKSNFISSLKFDDSLEQKYMLNKVTEESGGLQMIFLTLAIVNPGFIALDFVRLDSPWSSVYARILLEVIFISTVFISGRLDKRNVQGYQGLFFASSFVTYCYLLISDHINQGEYYELFAANITVMALFINGSFIGLRFRHSIFLNLLILALFIGYAIQFSTETFHKEQIPFVIIFFLICTILSFLFEKRSRSLFLGKEYIEDQNAIITQNNKKLKDENELKNSLMSILTHDIKAPLSSLNTLLELNSKEVISKEATIEHFNKVGKSVKGISVFVSTMILWIKSQMDGLHVNKSETNIKMLVDEIINLSSEQASQKKVAIEHHISTERLVMLDKEMIAIVIRNILSNAIKFSHHGGKVVIKEIDKPDTFAIQIIDAGIGMDQNQIEALFNLEPKESTFGTSNEPGTGLGLLISYNLMRKMNGKLDCTSIPEKGTVFTISLEK